MELRQYQVFESALQDEQHLACLDSPWLDGPDARLPLEHWEVLGQLAVEKEWVDLVLWEKMSDLDGADFSLGEQEEFFECLLRLQAYLRLDLMLMLQRTADCPEPLPGCEHSRMLEAVIQVFQLSGQQTDSYVDQDSDEDQSVEDDDAEDLSQGDEA